jgi:O-acetyl-ADP-ribose deacetylase (regulator of RNase III)
MDLNAKQHSQEDRKDHSEELKSINAKSLSKARIITTRYKGISLFRGSLIQTGADCVVNAANEGLMGGGGVDGLIHGLASSADGHSHDTQTCPLCAEIRMTFPANESGVRLETGAACVTSAYNIPGARFVVHTVGPYLDEAGNPQPSLLVACYKNALQCALTAGATSIAFPAISTGYYGYPMLDAGIVAIGAITEFFAANAEARDGNIPVYLTAYSALNGDILAALLEPE